MYRRCRPEDLLNLHHAGDDYILSLAKDPKVVKIAAQLLDSPDGVKIFATRILCKMPRTGQPVPWHQGDCLFHEIRELHQKHN